MIVKQYPAGNFDMFKLHSEISASGAVQNFSGVTQDSENLAVHGESLLNEATLDSVVASHVNNATEWQIYYSILDRKRFCEELMEDFKKSNIMSSITPSQAFWVHQRMREHTFTYGGTSFTIDLLNLVISGDVEIGCIAMMQFLPDSMELTHHFFTQERIDWLVNKMKAYLGW